MRFTVTWHPDARDELARMWLNASDRDAVTKAAHEVDRQLSIDAHLKGVDFYGDRLLVVKPLSVTYSVSVDDRLVEVLQVSRV